MPARTIKSKVTPKASKPDKVKNLILDITRLCIFDHYTPEICLSFYPKNKCLSGRLVRYPGYEKSGKTVTVFRVYGNSTASVLTKLAEEIVKYQNGVTELQER